MICVEALPPGAGELETSNAIYEERVVMDTVDVAGYARKLFKAHGDRAEVEAAQKAVKYEKSGDTAQAENWKRIRSAIANMRSPHAS